MKQLCSAIALIATMLLHGQSTVQMSLAEAQEYALKNAYSIQSQNLEVLKTRRIYQEQIARGLPQIFGSGDYTYNIERQAFVAQVGNELGQLTIGAPYSLLGGLNAEQLLFDGSYIIAVMASQVLQESALNDFNRSRADVREQVAKAYHLVLITERTLEIIDENLKFLNQNLTETTKLFENGFVDEQDVDQLELLVSNLLNNRVFAEKQIEIAHMLLKVNLGMPVEKTIALTDDITTLMTFTETGDNLLMERFELKNNLDYQGILIAERGRTLNARNEQWQYAPKIKAFYNLNYNVNSVNANVFQGNELERLDIRWQSVGVRASVPIFTGGSRNARVQQTKIELDQTLINKRQMEDNLKLQHTQARAEYEYALNSYMTQRRNVEIAKKIRDRTMTKYKAGLASSLDLTQAENQYQDSLRAAINAANSVLDKKVTLEKILGKYNY